MALYYDLPVYKDTYQLVKHVFEITKEFPKEYKYSLGQDMKRDALQLVRSIYRANKPFLTSFSPNFISQDHLSSKENRHIHNNLITSLLMNKIR